MVWAAAGTPKSAKKTMSAFKVLVVSFMEFHGVKNLIANVKKKSIPSKGICKNGIKKLLYLSTITHLRAISHPSFTIGRW